MSAKDAGREKENTMSNDLDLIATNFIRSGGTRNSWLAAFDRAAEQISRVGQRAIVSNGHSDNADARNPLPDLGHTPAAEAFHPLPGSGSHMPDDDRSRSANMAVDVLSSPGVFTPDAGHLTGAHARNHLPVSGDRMPREGHLKCAEEAKERLPSPGIPNAGHTSIAQARTVLPASEGRAAGGQATHAKGQHCSAAPTRPVSATRLAALRNAAESAARTIFDTKRTADGRSWGDVRFHELDGMERDGALAQAVRRRIGQVDESMRHDQVRQLLNALQFEACVAQAEGVNA